MKSGVYSSKLKPDTFKIAGTEFENLEWIHRTKCVNKSFKHINYLMHVVGLLVNPPSSAPTDATKDSLITLALLNETQLSVFRQH